MTQSLTSIAHFLTRQPGGQSAHSIPPLTGIPSEADAKRSAYEQGYADGKRDADAENEGLLLDQRRALDEEISAARNRWTQEEADRLAQHITNEINALEQGIALALTDLLKPFLKEKIIVQSLSDLEAATKQLWNSDETIRIEVEGPADLAERLCERLRQFAHVRLRENNTVTLRVIIEDTTLQTRLADWLNLLKDCDGREQ